MAEQATPEAEAQAFADGLNRGWDHANYCEAYAPADLDNESDYSGPNCREPYCAGWHEGVHRYRAGQWQDGTPRNN